MKLSQLSLADYNQLDSIPVINQDLSASGFTPVANTYYRHTGATTDTFTQGVIYLYDTAYHKLGESGGGGTTLNKYNVSLDYSANSKSANFLLRKIILNAKYIKSARVGGELEDCVVASRYNNENGVGAIYGMNFSTGSVSIVKYLASDFNNSLYRSEIFINSDGTVSISRDVVNNSALIQITYYNDVEITA